MLFTSALSIFMLASTTSAVFATGPYGSWQTCEPADTVEKPKFQGVEVRLFSLLAGGLEACVYTTKINDLEVIAKRYRKGLEEGGENSYFSQERKALELMDEIDRSNEKRGPLRYIGDYMDSRLKQWLFMIRVEGLPLQETPGWESVVGRGQNYISPDATMEAKVACVTYLEGIYGAVGRSRVSLVENYGILHTDTHLQNVLWNGEIPVLIDFGSWVKVPRELSSEAKNTVNMDGQKYAKETMDFEPHNLDPGICRITMDGLVEYLSQPRS